MITETVEMQGHLIDTATLPRVLDIILASGCDYEMLDFDMGRTSEDTSTARIAVRAPSQSTLETVIENIQIHGANRVDLGTAIVTPCDQDGVLPAGFYSTTNLPTQVFINDAWINVENPEMDCAIVIDDSGARTVPMHRVSVGDKVVTGRDGIKVELPGSAASTSPTFEFMNSEVSSEKPKALLVQQVAEHMRVVKEGGHPSGATKILAVCGPAVVHTGASFALAKLVRAGWIDVLFAGNGFATHDIESAVMGTSLGISVHEGKGTEGGHSNHLRVINEVRRHGSIAQAVQNGYIESGVMYECVRNEVPFVLGGSVRDDGPLPDTVTDVVEAADAMRFYVTDIALTLMLSTTLHAIATGNILPAAVETFCVDINQSVATKLTDRGSHQALGIVTDVGLFVNALADELIGKKSTRPSAVD